MKRSIIRLIILAVLVFFMGAVVNALTNTETDLGLDMLFHSRGLRTPPDNIVIVAMDEQSEISLGLWQDLTRWRGFHARLVHELTRQGVALIIFDLPFVSPQPEHDALFAKAIKEAGNVLTLDCTQKMHGDNAFDARDECGEGYQMPFIQGLLQPVNNAFAQIVGARAIAPTATLASAMIDHAPFYLANDAANPVIREAMLFSSELAELPSLPVVAWVHLLRRQGNLPDNLHADVTLPVWLKIQRRKCLANKELLNIDYKINSLAESRLQQLICGPDKHTLDYYGPPQTFRMVSYADVYDGKVNDLANKIVFVGKAYRQYATGKTDVFHTPFTDTRSGKIAGVEIMATQFANLLENRSVTAPIPHYACRLLFALGLGILLSSTRVITGVVLTVLASTAYLALAYRLFVCQGIWLPTAVPVLIQLPFAWLVVMCIARWDLLSERKRILAFVQRVFPQWLPMLADKPGHWGNESAMLDYVPERDVYGLCLATDIAGYTQVAAQRTAHQMWELLNNYYRALGQPVIESQGYIADVAGDAMIAFWMDLPPQQQRLTACLAALDMQTAVNRFNDASMSAQLPTRIGLHEGDMALGELRAANTLQFRAIGDTVNTASRIQGVNKYLGTHILASAAVVDGLSDIACRSVGWFRLVGREQALELFEIVGKASELTDAKRHLLSQFNTGLSAFQDKHWLKAITIFKDLLPQHDGPAEFYLALSQAYQQCPPPDFDGIIRLDSK